jgi:hypothetical protein
MYNLFRSKATNHLLKVQIFLEREWKITFGVFWWVPGNQKTDLDMISPASSHFTALLSVSDVSRSSK